MAGPFSRTLTFPINPKLIAGDSAVALELADVSTDTDVFKAIAKDEPFPERPGGDIPLGRIGVKASAGKPIQFKAGAGSVGFQPSASVVSEIGVFGDPTRALVHLPSDLPPGIDLAEGAEEGSLYMLMKWGWKAGLKFSASHPIGALASAQFGADVSGAQFFGLVHRFKDDTGARKAMAAATRSWCLPRHIVETDGDLCLEPGTWVMSEAEGSLGIKVGAQVGYNLSFTHEAELLGVTQNLSAKIDASVKATLGFNVAGRFLLVAGRESADPASKQIRLRLFKLRRNGWEFGLNLGVGFKGDTGLPEGVDDFIQGVFGVHGQQVVKDLQAIEKWTEKDPAQTAARLVRSTGLDMLAKVSGMDPGTHFESSREAVVGVLRKYVKLPPAIQDRVWTILAGGGEGRFTGFLVALTATDPKVRAKAFGDALQKAVIGDSPEGQFLAAAGEFGLLVAQPQIAQVEALARQTLTAMEGGGLGRLVTFARERLSLVQVTNAKTKPEFDAIDGWLIGRLSDFFGKTLGFDDLKPIQQAIQLAVTARKKIYGNVRRALHQRFSADLAVAYQKTTTKTALFDITFDLAQESAIDAYRELVGQSNFDRIVTEQIDGVTIHQGVLTHGIRRESSVDVRLPFFQRRVDHINETLAQLETLDAEVDGDRVLVYNVTAKDVVRDEQRFRSQLSLMGGFTVRDGELVVSDLDDKTIGYEFRQAKKEMRLSDLQRRVTPFLRKHFSNQLVGEDPIGTFLMELDRTVETRLHNGENNFGNVLLSMETAIPAAALKGWFNPLDEIEIRAAKSRISRRVQRALKDLIPGYYFQDSDNLMNGAASAALVVWSSIPPTTTSEDAFWNWPDLETRKAMALRTTTLRDTIRTYEERLRSEGRSRDAGFYEQDQAGRILKDGLGATRQLEALLGMEAGVIKAVNKAIDQVQDALTEAVEGAPQAALASLAEFGATMSKAFHDKVKSIYGDEASRALGSMVLLEATAGLDPTFSVREPNAAFRLLVIDPRGSFLLSDYIKGRLPLEEDVVLQQTLVNRNE